VKNKFSIILIVCIAATFTACSKITVKKPQGFAEVKKNTAYYAVSPEGALFRIRYTDNKPEKNLEFWKMAVKNHMADEGYAFIKEENFSTPGKPGIVFHWGAPFGNRNFVYVTAIIVFGKEIAIAEAACEYSLFRTYEAPIMASIKSISLN
jgi:hypothetical protein